MMVGRQRGAIATLTVLLLLLLTLSVLWGSFELALAAWRGLTSSS